MTSLLEARSAVHQRYRAYAIDVGRDLFGAWLVDMSYGWIGTTGRSKIRSFATIEGAQDQVRACLRKRATAPRRIVWVGETRSDQGQYTEQDGRNVSTTLRQLFV